MPKKIFLRPLNVEGSVEHYFHFLFGYLIPFLRNMPPHDGNTYLFRDCGPLMNPILLSLPGYDAKLLGRDKPDCALGFPGHDNVDFPGMDMPSVRDMLVGIFGAVATPSKEVLVVDRAEPHPFYESKAEIKNSGRSRRSVPNMGEVFESIRGSMPARLVVLEGMTLRDQIELFLSHNTFVMQHGASMANLLFARRGSIVLEFRSDETRDFYARMISSLGLRRSWLRQDHDHAAVDPEEALALLKKTMRSSIALL